MKPWRRALTRKARKTGVTPAQRRHKLVGPATLWKMKRAFQVRFLKEQGLKPGDSLLDLGCGTLRGGIPIIEYLEGGHYMGVDVRDEVIGEALGEVARAGLAAKEPRVLLVPNLSVEDLGSRFDVVWGFQVLIHMTDEILAEAAGFIERHLAERGRGYVSVKVGQPRERSWKGFPAVTRPLEFYEERFAAVGLNVLDLGPLTDFGHNIPRRSIEQQSSQRMLLVERSG